MRPTCRREAGAGRLWEPAPSGEADAPGGPLVAGVGGLAWGARCGCRGAGRWGVARQLKLRATATKPPAGAGTQASRLPGSGAVGRCPAAKAAGNSNEAPCGGWARVPRLAGRRDPGPAPEVRGSPMGLPWAGAMRPTGSREAGAGRLWEPAPSGEADAPSGPLVAGVGGLAWGARCGCRGAGRWGVARQLKLRATATKPPAGAGPGGHSA